MRYHLGSPRQVADAGQPGTLRVSLPPSWRFLRLL